jgi:LysM repeat protein
MLKNPKTTPVVRRGFHTVRSGETLISISRKYKTSPSQLASVNRMKSWKTKVKVGQRLALNHDEVSVKFSSLPKIKVTKSPIVYKVRAGDKLRELARIFGKDLGDMKEMNNIRRNKIIVGQKIILPDSQKGIYTVKHGDHLIKVSKDLNSSVEEIMKLNSLTRKKIYPGQKLIVDMD